ncbi:MAG: PAS domain S-box protein [Deltaproteobacteria bacterium]|nr:MAG: PAS domain S-box protein [Deltaproteobacteria bacterium]
MEEATYRELVENASDVIYAHDLEGRFTWVNRACERITGYTRDETLRLRIWDLVAAEYRAAMEKNLSGEMQTFEVEVVAKDGRRIPLELKSRLVYRGHMPIGVQGIARDVSERKRAAEAMRESEERYALAALGSNDGLWDWDLRANRIFFSARWKEQLGAKDSELTDDPDEWFDRVHPDDRERLFGDLSLHLEGRTPHLEVEHRVRHLDGNWRWMLVRGAAVRDADGRAYRLAGSQTDITARKLAEEKLLHDALHDGLTGLPNRSLFMDRLGQALAFQQRRLDYRFAVLFLDLDRFKTVNESLGHTAGDVLLVQVARRLRAIARPGDTVARLGGDEFALLLGDFMDPDARTRGPRSCCATPTRPCTAPRIWAAPGTPCSTPPCTRTPRPSSNSTPTCAARSSAKSCGCATSRWSRCAPGRSWAARRSSSGSTRRAGPSRLATSFPRPRRPD